MNQARKTDLRALAERCPHENIVDCPLYHETHNGRGMGCDDGRLEEGGCAVSRGLSYPEALGSLMARDARMVAQVEWNAQNRIRSEQRLRNMAALGMH